MLQNYNNILIIAKAKLSPRSTHNASFNLASNISLSTDINRTKDKIQTTINYTQRKSHGLPPKFLKKSTFYNPKEQAPPIVNNQMAHR